MVRKKGDTETQARSLKKKYSASEKKQYVLEHLGTMTYQNMAAKLKCTEANIYLILTNIRKERELIHPDLVSVTAEEQYNRLNTACRVSFSNLMKGYERLQNKTYDKDGKPSDAIEDKDIWVLATIHDRAEGRLTQFMKATGLYNPDIVQNNILNESTTITNVNIINTDKIYDELQEEYGKDFAQELMDKVEANKYVDVDYDEIIVDDSRGGRKKSNLLKGKKELEKEAEKKKNKKS